MKIKSRKQARKEFRKAKKLKKHEFFSKKKSKNKEANQNFPRKNVRDVTKQKGNFVKTEEIEKVTQKVEKIVRKKKSRKEFTNPQEKENFLIEKERKQKEKLDKDIQRQRIKQLKADNLIETREIQTLEKQLKMHKGKSKAFTFDGLDYLLDICDKKTCTNAFEKALDESDSEFESDLENIVGESKQDASKGKKKIEYEKKKIKDISKEYQNEDYEVLSSEKLDIKNDMESKDFSDDESDIDFESDEALEEKLNVQSVVNRKRKTDVQDNDLRTKMKNVIFKENSESDFNDREVGSEVENKLHIPKSWQDIYGRTRDEKGNVMNTYTPPHLRKKAQESDTNQKLERLKKQLKGLLNRLSETNMAFISNQIEQLYMSNSRNDMNETLWNLFSDSLVTEVLTPERLITEHAMLIAVLHANIGSEIGAHFLQYAVTKFCKELENSPIVEDKRINNILMFILQLYNFQLVYLCIVGAVSKLTILLCNSFKNNFSTFNNLFKLLLADFKSALFLFIQQVYRLILTQKLKLETFHFEAGKKIFHSKLMYDILNELLKSLEEKQIELLLTTLRTVGFNLRKDDPLALKSLVLKIQEQANLVSTGENSSRVKFMLEILLAIKNNNISKIPNYSPEFVEKLRKNLKVLIRKGNYSTELNISLQDLLNAEKHGRWWIVGSAWSGSVPSEPDANKSKSEIVPSTEFSQKLLALAKKQRMNTSVRRNIFCILMSAEDFLEAFEKLLKLKLKGAVEREIMNVLLHCALQEKNFNPYYVFLANKFCIFDRKYQMMLQCAIWDKIKELKSALSVQVTNFAKFIGNVILEKGLPISILKVIQFSKLDKPTIKFMRQVLLTILISEDRIAVVAVFRRIADSSKLKLFRESLRLFLQHFVLKNTVKNVEGKKFFKLAEMVKVAEQALISSDSTLVF